MVDFDERTLRNLRMGRVDQSLLLRLLSRQTIRELQLAKIADEGHATLNPNAATRQPTIRCRLCRLR
jgi:hypothetical protein